jgi:hypothetical protein
MTVSIKLGPRFAGPMGKVPPGFGLRQPAAALPPKDWTHKSGRGLPQSKTLSRRPHRPIPLAGCGRLETDLMAVTRDCISPSEDKIMISLETLTNWR